MNDKYNIICFSNQLWDFPNWTNKRHVMWRMARLGHNVLFVDPPINTGRLFLKQLLGKKWSFKRLLTKQYDDEKVRIFSPLDPLPFSDVTAGTHVRKINSISKSIFDKKRKTLLWIYHMEIPSLPVYIESLDYDALIYDCVDNYAGFPKYNTEEKKQQVRDREKYLAEKADVLFGTTPALVESLKKYNSNVHFTPNVGDYEMFKDVKKLKGEIPNDITDIPRPRIGFVGALDEYKFDAELVKKVALDHPNYSFILIGQIALKDKDAGLSDLGLAGIDNIYFLGARPYQKKKYYMAGFDAEIIPYQLNDYTVGGCFPVKFFDSLAAGLPVIVTNLPSYSPFKDVSYISRNYEEFSKNIKIGLEEDSEARVKQRQLVAKENDWDGKVAKMLDIVNEYLRSRK